MRLWLAPYLRLRQTLAFLVIVASYCVLPALILLLARFGASMNSLARWAIMIGALALLFALSPLRLSALRVARRLLAGSAEEILERAKEGIVVYLRGFRDDDSLEQDARSRIWRFLFPRSAEFGSRPEERLVIAARGVGPLVALGRPRERLPQIGAARLYILHEDRGHWKQVVRNLCGKAGLVILQVGKVTPGVTWELQNVPRFVPPERLLLYLPRRPDLTPQAREDEYTAFRSDFPQMFGKPFPPRLGDARCIVFDTDGTPNLIDPWSLPIKSNVAVLNEDHGLFLTPAELGLDDDSLCMISAIERNYPNYCVPREADLPFDMRVYRAFEISVGPAAKLIILAALASLIWPHLYERLERWLSQWL